MVIIIIIIIKDEHRALSLSPKGELKNAKRPFFV